MIKKLGKVKQKIIKNVMFLQGTVEDDYQINKNFTCICLPITISLKYNLGVQSLKINNGVIHS